MKAKLNKSPLRERLKRLSPLRDWSAFPPKADNVLEELFSSMVAGAPTYFSSPLVAGFLCCWVDLLPIPDREATDCVHWHFKEHVHFRVHGQGIG